MHWSQRSKALSSLTFIALLCGGSAVCQTATGLLSGSVAGSDGAPISAIVVANRVGASPAAGRAESLLNGSFSITGLPDGTYELCASDKGGKYLDPCTWSARAPRVVISSGQSATNIKLILERGTPLQVRVNDPSQVLGHSSANSNANSNNGKSHLEIGVFTDRGTFQRLGTTSTDANGRNQQTPIPFDRPVPLHLVGRGISVTDGSGQSLDVDTGATQTVKHAKGDSTQPMIFTVKPKP